MESYGEFAETDVAEQLLRLDRGHSSPEKHPGGAVLRSRRVRQVLVGAVRGRHTLPDSTDDDAAATLRLCTADDTEAAPMRRANGRVIRRFRDNLHTLTHIARDPLLCYAEQGAVLTDLRETLYLTESALRQFEAVRADSPYEPVRSEAILAIANVVEDRVDRLFERMERLTALRQALYRMSAILEGVCDGLVPRVHEIDELTTMVVDALEDDVTVTLLDPDSPRQSLRVAAHALNVAQVVARLALTVPDWQDELSLAVSAALLQDLGMMEVPEEVFESTDLLTPTQRTLVQKHPCASVAIVQQMRGRDDRLADAVAQHHERLDGSGYPGHLRGNAIGPVARLLAVADSFVGIQSPRPYRPALNAAQAIVEIDRAAAEGRLDPAWTARLRSIETHWIKIPVAPEPPSSAPAVSARAA
jgi:HD-GYP domain-containing protein (c-di-GMP phosphodiesterase class II)